MSDFAVNYLCSHGCGTVLAVGMLQNSEVEGGRKITFGWPEVKVVWLFWFCGFFFCGRV